MPRGAHVVVGCSGGADSVALAVAMAELATDLGVSFVVAGVDHGLRPEAADELDRVEALAQRLGRPFHRLRVEIGAGCLQAKAREARYAALLGLARRLDAPYVAVGHTLDDQAETVLVGILRGKRPEAWGMAARRADGVVRPLLGCRRAALRAFLRSRSVEWAEDPSNDDVRFERVRVRQLLPSLEALDLRALEHLAEAAGEVSAARRIVRAHGARALARARAGAEGLRLGPLLVAPAVVRREALRGWLAELEGAPRRRHVDALDRLTTSQRGELLLRGGRALRVVDGQIVLGRGPARTRSQRGGGPTSR